MLLGIAACLPKTQIEGPTPRPTDLIDRTVKGQAALLHFVEAFIQELPQKAPALRYSPRM